MKKMVVLVFLTVSLIAFKNADCGGQSAAASTSESDIEVWYANLDRDTTQIVNDLAASLSGPNGKVNASVIPTEEFRTKIKVVMGSGGAPDIFVGWGGGATEQFINEGQLYDLTNDVRSWKNDVYAASWDEATFNGKIYMVPYNVHGSMFYYNKTMFEKYGIAAPKTYRELQAAAEKLKSNGIIPFALGNRPKWPGAIYHSDLVLRIGGKQAALDALNNTGKGFMDDAYIRANQLVLDEFKAGWYPNGANGINYESGGSRALFYDGRAGMLLSNGNFAPSCRTEAPDFYNNDLAILPFPIFEDGKGNDAIICGIEALSITEKCKNKPLALEYIRKWTVDPEVVNQRANLGGTMVTYTKVRYNEKMRQDMWDYLTGAKFVNNYIADMLPAEVGNLYWDLTQALFGGLISAEEASSQLQALNNQITPKK
jgi:raffinose/stachyose/melibiose transport system substrate-binding protein